MGQKVKLIYIRKFITAKEMRQFFEWIIPAKEGERRSILGKQVVHNVEHRVYGDFIEADFVVKMWAR